jgi:serine/threonine protein kinase
MCREVFSAHFTLKNKDNMYKYEIIQQLAQGTGTVINLCKKQEQYVVIKELIESKYFDNLEEELNILLSLSPHKHIINLNKSFIFGQKIYLEYEYYEKGDLYDCIKLCERFEEKQARLLLSQLVSALIHAKAMGYNHCDIKPENILLRQNGEFVLCDWDLAKKIDNTDSSLNYGSSLSMAPEVILGQISDVSDVYSLGCLLYFSLFGKRVFDLKVNDGKDKRVLNHLEQEVDFPDNNISTEFLQLIKAMLFKNPKQRITLYEIQRFLNVERVIFREDKKNIYDNIDDFIDIFHMEKNKIKSSKKYEQWQKKYSEDATESSKNTMFAHLIIMAYLQDKEAQHKLSLLYEEGIDFPKDSIKASMWKQRAES